jgi:hypothetical protein
MAHAGNLQAILPFGHCKVEGTDFAFLVGGAP